MRASGEPLVYWLDPWAWDKEMEMVPLHAHQDPVQLWLDLIHALGWKVMLLPYDTRIRGGPCHGGHVVAVETGAGRQFAALPPQAILALQTEIPPADYQALLRATPALRPSARQKRSVPYHRYTCAPDSGSRPALEKAPWPPRSGFPGPHPSQKRVDAG